jgi:hypothetical protein
VPVPLPNVMGKILKKKCVCPSPRVPVPVPVCERLCLCRCRWVHGRMRVRHSSHFVLACMRSFAYASVIYIYLSICLSVSPPLPVLTNGRGTVSGKTRSSRTEPWRKLVRMCECMCMYVCMCVCV